MFDYLILSWSKRCLICDLFRYSILININLQVNKVKYCYNLVKILY
jgi:hypothetical protein